jgi:alpha-amylase
MKKVKFLLGIHCHQPVGNFPSVFEEAYEKSYLPFIKAMEAHPKIKFSVHYSGILYDWFKKNRPEFLDLLKSLIKRGQVDVMTAGHYEPIIPIIPDADKIGQIKMQTDFIKNKFGTIPRGMWLTERIWEPSLPALLSDAGIEYVTVDDYHFISAGLPENKLLGYYITEDAGKCLKVFPINKNLRYLIPFELPAKTIEYLRSIASEDGSSAAILADDGEKFGVWPGTHKWVFEEGYLENLLNELEKNSDWIEFMTFSEYIDSFEPIGRIYLPTASYFEMMEWSLLTESGKKLGRIIEDLKREGKFSEYAQFFKGGFFRNFFVKYPESNNMHKRMLEVSERIDKLRKSETLIGSEKKDGRLKKAVEELYQGQCNCAYWHGVFGGLYLNYLRHAVYEHLIRSELEIDRFLRADMDYVELSVTDFDKDGKDEVRLSNSLLNLYIAPSYGGAIFELDYKPKAFNLIDTLSRKEEVYHGKLREAGGGKGEAGGISSIHDALKVKEEGLEKKLIYDWHRRISLLDHFLGADTDLEKFSSVNYKEVGDFTISPYRFFPKRSSSEVELHLSRDGVVDGALVKLEKTVSLLLKQSIVSIEYKITNLSKEAKDLWFGSEFNFSMLAGNAPDRFYEIEGVDLNDKRLVSCGEVLKSKLLKIIDEWSGFVISLETGSPTSMWRFPIETVSRSEGGLESMYQSSVVFPNWKFRLGPQGCWSEKITLRIEE